MLARTSGRPATRLSSSLTHRWFVIPAIRELQDASGQYVARQLSHLADSTENAAGASRRPPLGVSINSGGARRDRAEGVSCTARRQNLSFPPIPVCRGCSDVRERRQRPAWVSTPSAVRHSERAT